MVILKSYLEFIKESKNEEIFRFETTDLMEYFLEFEDEGWEIIIERGFVMEVDKWIFGKNKYEKVEQFNENAIPGEREEAYWVAIHKKPSVKKTDLTDTLLFAHDIIKDITNAREIQLLDENNTLIDINDIMIKGEFVLGKGLSEEEQHYMDDAYISLFIKTGNYIEITEKQAAEKNMWDYHKSDENGNIFTRESLEDLANSLIDHRCNYLSILLNRDEIWDSYYHHEYEPDINSLFQYTLDKENEVLSIKAIIKEQGGWDSFKEENVVANIDEEFKSEDDFISYVLSERFYHTLKEISEYSDVFRDIVIHTAADYSLSAHVESNYNSILHSFYQILDDEFNYKMVKVMEEKEYTSNGEVKKYEVENTYFDIAFDIKWIEDILEDLPDFNSVSEILYEYIGNIGSYRLDPYFSDYGNVDDKALNSDIKSSLKKYLEN